MLKYANVMWDGNYKDQFWKWNGGVVPDNVKNKIRGMGISEDNTARGVLIDIIYYIDNLMKQSNYMEQYTIKHFADEFADVFPTEAFGPPSTWDIEQGYERIYRPLQSMLSHDPEVREIWDQIGLEKRKVNPRQRGTSGPRIKRDVETNYEDRYIPKLFRDKLGLGYKVPKGLGFVVELEGDISPVYKSAKVFSTEDFNKLIDKIKENKLTVQSIRILQPDITPENSNQLTSEANRLSMIFNGADVIDSRFRKIQNSVSKEDFRIVTEFAEEGASVKELMSVIDGLDPDTAKTMINLYGPSKMASYASGFCKLANIFDRKGLKQYASSLDKAMITIYNTIKAWNRKQITK